MSTKKNLKLLKNSQLSYRAMTKALVISSEEYIKRSKGAQSIVASTPILNADNQRKRPAEEASPIITSPPNLRDRQYPRAQILANIGDDDFFDDYNESEKEEESTEVIENEEVVNLSENDLTDPVNKIFSNDDKEKMRKIWKEMEPSAEEKENTMRRSRWKKSIKPLIEKYASAVERNSKSVFDDDDEPRSTKVVFEMPFEGEFALKKYYDMLWTQDIYRRLDSFINPLIPKVFDDILDKISGEIESSLRKKHRNETNGRKPRVNLGSKHDGILKIYMNATEMEIGFLEVVGNAVNGDVTGYYGDMENYSRIYNFKIFIYSCLERPIAINLIEFVIFSFGVLVYQRETTIYTMHRAKGGLHIVDIVTNFTIPDSKDQAYVISEKCIFSSRVMDYYSKLQDISPKVQEYSHINENLLEASPSKRKSARR
ncbi:16099_t:CDS:2, partial [Funneliformis mosseae]